MYYVGKKQKDFNINDLLSEFSVNWVTYFNPNSKLIFQTAKHWNSAGVKEFEDVQKATEFMDALKAFGIKGCFVAKIDKNGSEFIHE